MPRPKITSLGSLKECDRPLIVATIANLGIEGMYDKWTSPVTSSPSTLANSAWSYIADGMGEDAAYEYLLGEINHLRNNY